MTWGHTRSFHALTLAGALLASLPAGAQTVAKASVAVTGLQFRLIDLAPDDGIAPSLTVGNMSLSLSSGYDEPLIQGWQDMLLPPQTVSRGDALGGSQVGPDGLSASSHWTVQDVSAHLESSQYGSDLWRDGQWGAGVASGELPAGYDTSTLILSANTLLEIRGTLQVDLERHLENVTLADFPQTPVRYRTSAYSNYNANIYLTGTTNEPGDYNGTSHTSSFSWSDYFNGYWEAEVGGEVYGEGGLATNTASKAFSVSLNNLTDGDMGVSLQAYTRVALDLRIGASFPYQPPPPVPGVPEPTTFALMALGLGGMVAAHRRARSGRSRTHPA